MNTGTKLSTILVGKFHKRNLYKLSYGQFATDVHMQMIPDRIWRNDCNTKVGRCGTCQPDWDRVNTEQIVFYSSKAVRFFSTSASRISIMYTSILSFF
jgi:hypothetical protein